MNNKKTTFVRQASILAVAGILVRIIGFLYRLPLFALIGDRGNGIYGAGYYLYTFFLIMASAGLPAAISKMVSERISLGQYRNAHEVFRVALGEALVFGLIGSLALGFGASALANAVDSPNSYYCILTLSPTVFIVSIMAVFRGYFQGMNNTVPTAFSQIVEQVFNAFFSVLLAYLLMKKTNDIALGAAGGTAGTGIGAFAGLLCLVGVYSLAHPSIMKKIRRERNTVLETRKNIGIEVIKTAFPIIIGTAIFSITNLIDMKMVNSRLLASGYTQDQAEAAYGLLTGKYVPLTTLPVSISTAIATAAIPSIASAIIMGMKSDANRRINVALRLSMILSVPAAVGIGVLGSPILELLFPSGASGGDLLRIGSVSIIFLALAQITTGMLQGAGYVQVPVIGAFCGAVVKVVLNYFLISMPSINVKGAVISTTACYIVAAGIDLFVLKLIMGKKAKLDLFGGFLKPVIASVVMGLASYAFYVFLYTLIPNNAFACIVAIMFGMIVYVCYMYIIKGITHDDVALLPMGGKISWWLQHFDI